MLRPIKWSIIILSLLYLITLSGLNLVLAAASPRQQATPLFPYSDGELYGYVDLAGEWIIEPRFTFADTFSEGLALVTVGEKYGYIDQTGDFVIEPQFAFAYPFVEGLAAASLDRKAGFIDQSGQFVVEPQFDFAANFAEGLAAVGLQGKTGYVNPEGELVIEPQYEFASDFVEGLAAVSINGKYGYIDQTGALVIEPTFDFATDFAEGLAAVTTGNQTGYIDRTGQMIIPPTLAAGFPFSEGLAFTDTGDASGYIDQTGQMVIQGNFDFGLEFSEGLAAVEVDGLYGFIDQEGNWVVEPQFVSAASFRDGLAYVQLADSWGYIDQSGQLLFELPLATLINPSSQTTTVINYLPSVPDQTQAGSCWTSSLVTPIASAWRCMVDNQIFDPCLIADDGQTLVCGTDPSTGEPGFQLDLTEPLPQPEAVPQPETTGPKLSLDILKNATYLSDWYEGGTVQLNDGYYEERYGEGETDRAATSLIETGIAFGDLDFDGSEDAIVLLVTNGGGTGQFYDLQVVLNDNGQPNAVAYQPLGDRIILNDLSINHGIITVDMITQGPTDGACCPTLPLTLKYELQADQLAPANLAWLFQLADGEICSFATGATGLVDNKRLNFACSDGGWVIGGLQPGVTWLAEKVMLSETDPFSPTAVTMTNVSTIWEPVDPAVVSQEIGLTPEQVTVELRQVAQSMQGHLRPAVRYDPAVPPALNGEPAHLRFTFDDQPLTVGYGVNLSAPQLLIYPVEAYRQIYQVAAIDDLEERINRLQSLLQDRPDSIEGELPVLPDMGATQVITAQVEYLEFAGGSGIRFISYYAQDASPILSGQIFYTFQGLTDDGNYYVAYFQPLATTTLPDSYEDSAAAEDEAAFAENYETYLRETIQALDEAAPADYSPDLSQLDGLIESLQLQ
jgi:hypothetical protein